jgi:hypothetical protein
MPYGCTLPQRLGLYRWRGFTDLVIDTIFGANLTLFEGIGIQSHLTDFDPKGDS